MFFLLPYFFFITYTHFFLAIYKNIKKIKFEALAVNSWIKNDWQTALNASKKIANKCFFTAIESNFLLNSNNHLKYVQQVN
jgi:hypothetical protein